MKVTLGAGAVSVTFPRFTETPERPFTEELASVSGYWPTLVETGTVKVALHVPSALVPETLVRLAERFTVPRVATIEETSDPYTTARVLTVNVLPTTTAFGEKEPLRRIGAAA